MDKLKIIVFNGSPRKKGTSYSFARTIKNIAEEKGNSAEIIHIIDYLEGGKSFDALAEMISDADVIALVSPLYVDSLPYPVIWFFERLSSNYKEILKGKSFFAVGQSAFPYIKVLEPLLGSCKCFSESVGMNWMGGLAYGGGVMLNGAYLEDLGDKGKRITSGFELALQDISENNIIGAKAQELLTIKFPRVLSRPMAMFLNHKVRLEAKKLGITDLKRKSYF